jgi:hypothetical protein
VDAAHDHRFSGWLAAYGWTKPAVIGSDLSFAGHEYGDPPINSPDKNTVGWQ